MVLSFRPQFISKILDGSKIHTIRADKHNRWKAGMKIHFVTGARTKHYRCFKEGVCTGVQSIFMNRGAFGIFDVFVDGKHLNSDTVKILAGNDGFGASLDFIHFFGSGTFRWEGKIIHWTGLKY